ncbi:hypothetical protein M422DRAFT_277195 [Sphaerobolus stellatus SS14]|uniref:Uncharacterized protein n=1 Tax=Sphaerobolus stellatus (strain SS14) TaxID=990650 RepID=A0A0C9UBA3_SPHS4|nr:hypothetical protein M422DRAFT_277195 [Sphaerobolus stellatus SS14]
MSDEGVMHRKKLMSWQDGVAERSGIEDRRATVPPAGGAPASFQLLLVASSYQSSCSYAGVVALFSPQYHKTVLHPYSSSYRCHSTCCNANTASVSWFSGPGVSWAFQDNQTLGTLPPNWGVPGLFGTAWIPSIPGDPSNIFIPTTCQGMPPDFYPEPFRPELPLASTTLK